MMTQITQAHLDAYCEAASIIAPADSYYGFDQIFDYLEGGRHDLLEDLTDEEEMLLNQLSPLDAEWMDRLYDSWNLEQADGDPTIDTYIKFRRGEIKLENGRFNGPYPPDYDRDPPYEPNYGKDWV